MASLVNKDFDDKTQVLNSSSSSSSSLGFIKFLEGFYMIVITRRSQIARIGYHRIYKIDETITLGITNEDIKKSHPDESKYEELGISMICFHNFSLDIYVHYKILI